MNELPFEPELVESLKERFSEATERTYDTETVMRGLLASRRHVLDFYDGTRMVVAKERVEGDVFLHVRVSFHQGTEIKGMDLVRMVISKVNEMRGYVPGLVKVFEAHDGLAHFLFPENEDVPKGWVVPPFPNAN